jgi:hypothetical protein
MLARSTSTENDDVEAGCPDRYLRHSIAFATPVVARGEMAAHYHKCHGSAGLMMVNDIHSKIQEK